MFVLDRLLFIFTLASMTMSVLEARVCQAHGIAAWLFEIFGGENATPPLRYLCPRFCYAFLKTRREIFDIRF